MAKHEANSGLWTREPPILEPAKKVHQKLLADGKVQEAMGLQAAVLHNVWTKERATDDPLLQICHDAIKGSRRYFTVIGRARTSSSVSARQSGRPSTCNRGPPTKLSTMRPFGLGAR